MPAPDVLVPVLVATDISAVRRAAVTIAEQCGLDEQTIGAVAIVATETASNVLKHASGGEVLIRRCESQRSMAVEIMGLDKGPGLGNAARCFEDGYSTAGSAGTGLGAMRRFSSFFAWFSHPASGTVMLCRVGETDGNADPVHPSFEVSGINVPYPGEEVSGDSWAIHRSRNSLRILLADGLGHGPFAHEASAAATDSASISRFDSPSGLLEAQHHKLKPTRGAAASAAYANLDRKQIAFCGVGNVVGVILSKDSRRQMLTANGTLGRETKKMQDFSYPFDTESVLVLHSDGLSANWSLEKYPGLFHRSPGIIAAVLFRDYRRTRDDASVVVARLGRES